MAHSDTVDGWGVVDERGLDIRTISDTRRAAIINWLVTKVGRTITNGHTDDQINAIWDKARGDATAEQVVVAVRR